MLKMASVMGWNISSSKVDVLEAVIKCQAKRDFDKGLHNDSSYSVFLVCCDQYLPKNGFKVNRSGIYTIYKLRTYLMSFILR